MKSYLNLSCLFQKKNKEDLTDTTDDEGAPKKKVKKSLKNKKASRVSVE